MRVDNAAMSVPRPRRLSVGRRLVWQDALAFAWSRRRPLTGLLAAILAATIVVNIPWWPAYERGLLTGILLVAAAWMVAWTMWVTSGLSQRLNGVWAEEVTLNCLRRHPRVYETVPSFKFHKYDVDAVAICPSGVLAVEVKWRYGDVGPDFLTRAADQAARGCRSLRHQIPTDGLSTHLVTPVVVVWGPSGHDLTPIQVPVTVGAIDSVTVLGGGHLDAWLTAQESGLIGPDYALRLQADLEPIAVARDEAAMSVGPVTRWFSRIR